MRISLVIQDLYRLGAQYVTAMVANGLAQRGHEVAVVVSAVHDRIGRESPDLKPFPLDPRVALVHLPHVRASRNAFALARHFRRYRPDAILPMSGAYEVACAIARQLALRRRTTRLIPVEHSSGLGLRQAESRVSAYRGPRLPAILYHWVADSVDGVVAVSKGSAEALGSLGKYAAGKIHVIYNPVVDARCIEKQKSAPSHPWLSSKTAPVLVAAGAHVPFKGHDVLLRAFERVCRQHPCRLILFGEGPLTEFYRKLAASLGISDSVSMPGYTANLPAELKAADAFVVSSHCESFSVVLVEALACGVPVVATNCPSGPPEILRNGQYGLLVQPDNPAALAEGIVKVLEGRGIRPPAESWEPYRLERIIDQYEALLVELLAAGRAK